MINFKTAPQKKADETVNLNYLCGQEKASRCFFYTWIRERSRMVQMQGGNYSCST